MFNKVNNSCNRCDMSISGICFVYIRPVVQAILFLVPVSGPVSKHAFSFMDVLQMCLHMFNANDVVITCSHKTLDLNIKTTFYHLEGIRFLVLFSWDHLPACCVSTSVHDDDSDDVCVSSTAGGWRSMCILPQSLRRLWAGMTSPHGWMTCSV